MSRLQYVVTALLGLAATVTGCCMCETMGPFSEAEVTVEEGEGGPVSHRRRTVVANGLPNHPTGCFPIDACPFSIAAQDYSYSLPELVGPREETYTELEPLTPIGIAVNGVLFDPSAAEWWIDKWGNEHRDWEIDVLSKDAPDRGVDWSNAHVQPDGAYHYHGVPNGLIAVLTGGAIEQVRLGWALDGTPIYGPYCFGKVRRKLVEMQSSWQTKTGPRPPEPKEEGGPGGPGGDYSEGLFVADYEYVDESGHLDKANGHTAYTSEDGNSYHYHATSMFPYLPRYFLDAREDY